ncbi:MAG: hypothetical protein L0Y35_07455 [Flammeovirgaceae bacterium]|nr:hypothetical protein [Flammeovirgaceae bacterium]
MVKALFRDMVRGALVIFFLVSIVFQGYAQLRLSKLVLNKKEIFSFDTLHEISVDSLILGDSSILYLNKLEPKNFIRAKFISFGEGCIINGQGIAGRKGKVGAQGNSPVGPCQSGTRGGNGYKGVIGTNATHLYLYFDRCEFKGTMFINLEGGNGADGGNGGTGGNGSSGTIHCFGGNGGSGGDGGNGGNGGDGGSLTIICEHCPNVRAFIGNEIRVKNQGGYYGREGKGGYFGYAGLGPSNKNGRDGVVGKDGSIGVIGRTGTVYFGEEHP